jgi:hypothetical protein
MRKLILGALLLLSTLSFGQNPSDKWVSNTTEAGVKISSIVETINSQEHTNNKVITHILKTKNDDGTVSVVMVFSSNKSYDLNSLRIAVILSLNGKDKQYVQEFYYNEETGFFFLEPFKDKKFLSDFKLAEYMYIYLYVPGEEIGDNLHQFSMNGSSSSYNFVSK